MALTVVCGNGHRGRVRDEMAGKRIKCPRCGDVFAVPASDPEEIAAPPGRNAPDGPARKRMSLGYWIAVGGLAAFLALIGLGALLQPSGAAEVLLVYVAFLALAAGLWVGTAFVAVEKGHHVALGVALGVIGPLGLLIVTVLPDRAATSA
ncbi:MAG: hypothetical protein WD069_07680 [Planctomycetales bacterium]